MARTIPDLDERDFTVRDQLRQQLRQLREDQGVSQRELGERIGADASGIRRLERQGVLQSRLGTTRRWAGGLHHHLVTEPVGFPPARKMWRSPTASGVDAILALLVHTEGLAGDDWAAPRLIADLVGIRVACGVTQRDLARRLDLTEQAVSFMETATMDSALVVLQRYPRAVAACSQWRGGHLAVRLEPIVQEPQHTVDSCSGDTAVLVPSA
jgi:transcriptional regulator with XRE-family HTH domain